ncbi:MAG: aminotransferase class I/II-fold pyridoxal phosphate-dependent enzyme [Treponema sp.]|nr:aminotransferase class I/II-fold pyridoxal phosphate-dependent enzyme [Treponema sp.]
MMRTLLEKAGLPLRKGETAIIPILTGSAEKALTFAKNCRSQGILLSAIRPPSVPVGTARIRLTVTAAHSREEIEKAAEIMTNIWRKI